MRTLRWSLVAVLYYCVAVALAATVLKSASVMSDVERTLSRMETPEEKTDTLVKGWMELLSLGLYSGASEKARQRARIEKEAGYHRGRVNGASAGIAAASALFLGALAWPVRRGPPDARRRLALHLHGVAAVCLVVGLAAPMLTVVAQRDVAVLGTVVLQFETKSILGTVRDLYSGGSVFVAVLLALFSVVVPGAKLTVSLLALLAPGPRARDACVRFVTAIGKWSMTDVFVVAVLLAFLAGGGELTDARLGPGLYFFAVYGLLSMVGGMLLAAPAGSHGAPSPRGLPPAGE